MQFSRARTIFVTVVVCVLVSSKRALGQDVLDECTQDSGCDSRCCWTSRDPSKCGLKSVRAEGEDCNTGDGCDCEDDLVCNADGKCAAPPTPSPGPTACTQDSQCDSQCCASGECTAKFSVPLDGDCSSGDGCECEEFLVCNVDKKCGELCGYYFTAQLCVEAIHYLGDGIDCRGACNPSTCCREEETCGDWDGTCPEDAPDRLPDSRSCGGPCDESTCCDDEDDDTWGDPHMRGLRGQKINWSGVDGGWYSLIKDDNVDLNIHVRVTAPLPDDFPDRQLITGLAVLSEGHSVVIEVENPYTIDTGGCPEGVSPCLANGGLRIIVDGQEVDDLLRFSRQVPVADGAISMSASNLPVECRQFGGDRIWARMTLERLAGKRELLLNESLEEWILRFDNNMAAPDWCAKYIAENDLADLQSTHAIFKIETPTVTVRLNAGVNYQRNGDLTGDGRVLPDLEFWQMDVGMNGLDIDNSALSGLLGETARPVYDENGQAVMQGSGAVRGTVEDYRVSDALGVHFRLLDKKEEGHE